MSDRPTGFAARAKTSHPLPTTDDGWKVLHLKRGLALLRQDIANIETGSGASRRPRRISAHAINHARRRLAGLLAILENPDHG